MMKHLNLRSIAAFSVAVSASLVATAFARDGYTVNGAAVAPEVARVLQHYGYAAGAYYVDANGNWGRSGEAPQGNLSGGPVRGWSGVEPRHVAGNPHALAYVNGVRGVRVFWVYSPSMFSGATGGSSGYVHICDDGVFYKSSEGAINVGGGAGEGWAGVAGTSASAGRWAAEPGANGPDIVFYHSDGSTQRVPLATMIQGGWKWGNTKYAAEVGKASCGR